MSETKKLIIPSPLEFRVVKPGAYQEVVAHFLRLAIIPLLWFIAEAKEPAVKIYRPVQGASSTYLNACL